jgi:thioredoxin 1
MSQQRFEVTDTNFHTEVLESRLPVLVEFGAEWCPPCHMLEPLVEKLAIKYQAVLRVVTVDGDTNPEAINDYEVYGLPTLILFKEGKAVGRWVGFMPYPRLETAIVPFIEEIQPAS